MKRFICMMLVFLLLPISAVFAAQNSVAERFESAFNSVIKWKNETLGLSTDKDFPSALSTFAGNGNADWFALAAARGGVRGDYGKYREALKNHIRGQYAGENSQSGVKATDCQRMSLVLLSFGESPSFDGIDLLAEGTYLRARVTPLNAQGVNAVIWAIITLNSSGTEIPANANTSMDEMLSLVFAAQNDDGGFSLAKGESDPDLTAMALQALSFFPNDAAAQSAVSRALSFLSEAQTENGGFVSYGTENSLCCAQVLIALESLGIDPSADERFIKNGFSLPDALCRFQNKDGGFSVTANTPSSESASAQAMLALASHLRFLRGDSVLFSLTDARVLPMKRDFGLLIGVSLGAVAAGAVAFIFLWKRRKKKP